jgi:hypothetical protein
VRSGGGQKREEEEGEDVASAAVTASRGAPASRRWHL